MHGQLLAEAVWKLFEFFRRWGNAALQVLLASAQTTETRFPALNCSKSVVVYHLYFKILRFHTASAISGHWAIIDLKDS